MFYKILRRITTTLAVLLTAAAIPVLLPLLFTPSSDDIANNAPIITVPLITLLTLLIAFFSAPIIYMPTFGIIGYFVIKKWSERQERKQSATPKPPMPVAAKSALRLANAYLFTGAVAELVIAIVVALIGETTTNNADSIGATLTMPSVASLVSLAIIIFSIAKRQSSQQGKVPLTKTLFTSALIISLAPAIAILIMFGRLPAEYYDLAQPFITISTLVGAIIFLTMAFIWYSYTNFIGHAVKSYNVAKLYRLAQQNIRNIILLSITYCAICVYLATNIFDHFDWGQFNAYLPLMHDLIISCPGILFILINLPILVILPCFWRYKLKQADAANVAITPYNLVASTMSALSFLLLFIPFITPSALAPILIARAASKEALKEDNTDTIARTTRSLSKFGAVLYIIELVITVIYFKTVL